MTRQQGLTLLELLAVIAAAHVVSEVVRHLTSRAVVLRETGEVLARGPATRPPFVQAPASA